MHFQCAIGDGCSRRLERNFTIQIYSKLKRPLSFSRNAIARMIAGVVIGVSLDLLERDRRRGLLYSRHCGVSVMTKGVGSSAGAVGKPQTAACRPGRRLIRISQTSLSPGLTPLPRRHEAKPAGDALADREQITGPRRLPSGSWTPPCSQCHVELSRGARNFACAARPWPSIVSRAVWDGAWQFASRPFFW
jgi:hypothetical protein